jgi:NADH-quinone oxidoreductase subunit N
MTPPDINFVALLPVVITLVTAAAITVLGFHLSRRALGILGIVGLLATIAASAAIWGQNLSTFVLAGVIGYRADAFALAMTMILALAGILALLVTLDQADRPAQQQVGSHEFYALLLYALSGTMLLAHANDLIVALIGFEVMSLAVYVLAAFKDRNQSEEAGLKYFLLGSLASAIMIYGMALLFGATGSFNLDGMRAAITATGFQNAPLLGMGALLVLIGFAFKVGWAPFHQWTPDVYSGAPLVVTQFMSVAIKTAAFAGFLRIFGTALPNVQAWLLPAELLIAITMLVGNLTALRQNNLKRMLAYSSVAQAAYIGLAVLALPSLGWPAAIYYLLAYTLMNAGVFAILSLLSNNDDGIELEDLAGLATRQPMLALALTFFMLSLAGVPPFAGFWGKYLVFNAAAQAGYWPLVVLGGLASAASLYYYARPVFMAYFQRSERVLVPASDGATRLVVGLGAVGIVLLGLLPNAVMMWLQGVGQLALK